MKNTPALLALVILSAVRASALTIPFETPGDLATYDMVSPTVNATFGQMPGVGAGTSGGAVFRGGTDNNERSAVAWKALDGTASEFGTWQTSILVSPKDIDTVTSGKDKIEARVGFSVTTDLGSKPHEFFHKINQSISVVLKAEHEPADPTKLRKLEAEMTNFNGIENKASTFTEADSPHFNEWLRVTLTLTRTGADTFDTSYSLESLGASGFAPASVLYSSPTTSFTNSALGAAETAYAAVVIKGEKLRDSALFLDEHHFEATATSPPAPVALEPSAVASEGFTAEWLPGNGVSASGFVVEISTAEDNFAPGSLIGEDGGTGLSSGISMADPAARDLAISGLLPETDYVYRVTGFNGSGSSLPSNVVSVTTLAGGVNGAPTLDAIAFPMVLPPVAGPQQIVLTGISDGGEGNQTVTVSASSDAPSVIPNPTVEYASPESTAVLTFDPAGADGTATITVTVDDGASMNGTTTRTVTVTVRTPPVTLGFDSAADFDEFVSVTTTGSSASYAWNAGNGTGDPAGGGALLSSSNTTGDRSLAVYRAQPYPLGGSSQLRTSVLLNLREVDDIAEGEAKVEISLGFTPETTLNESKPSEFLNKSTHGISVKLKAEHKPGDAGKLRKLEAELENNAGAGDDKFGKLTLQPSTAIDSWLRLTFTIIPTGGSDFLVSYRLEDLGEDGTDTAVTIMDSPVHTFTNALFGAAPAVYAGYAAKLDKSISRLDFDEHTVVVRNDPPDMPEASAPTLVTVSTFTANWLFDGEVFPTSYLLQVVPAGSAFEAGNFVSALGMPGQSGGIVVPGGVLRSFRLTGLAPATAYQYRVAGLNLNGASLPSGAQSVLTLGAGINAPPTLDAIPTPPNLVVNAGPQTIDLTGITDGGEGSQVITLSAVSDNPGLIPNPQVSYGSPATSGFLTYGPEEESSGEATITVTVSDGQANNATVARTFTITVVSPEPLIDFDDEQDVDRVNLTNENATFTRDLAAGANATPGMRFIGSTPNDRVTVGVRPTAFDARAASFLSSSVMVNFSQTLATTAKDKGEIRVGFMTENFADPSKPKDTMNKSHPSLGVKFKIEHEPAKPDKVRSVEGELFAFDGVSEYKAGSVKLVDVAEADHWFRVSLWAVRSGTNQYYLTYIVDDIGAEGAAFAGQVMGAESVPFSNPAFFTDQSVFAAFVLSNEKGQASELLVDDFESSVNTTAPDAPITNEVSERTEDGFTVHWTPPIMGKFPTGFLVEISDPDDLLQAGTFYSEFGEPGQATGILVDEPFAFDLVVTGLQRFTDYLVRVRAVRDGEVGPALNSVLGMTDFGPALTFAQWQESVFSATQLALPSVIAPNADPEMDGLANLLEYAFGLDPNADDSAQAFEMLSGSEFLGLHYRRRYNAEGIAYLPESSPDLVTWDSGDVVEIFASEPDAEGMQSVFIEDIVPMESGFDRYLRIRVLETD